jgi:hypothetical protein
LVGEKREEVIKILFLQIYVPLSYMDRLGYLILLLEMIAYWKAYNRIVVVSCQV